MRRCGNQHPQEQLTPVVHTRHPTYVTDWFCRSCFVLLKDHEKEEVKAATNKKRDGDTSELTFAKLLSQADSSRRVR